MVLGQRECRAESRSIREGKKPRARSEKQNARQTIYRHCQVKLPKAAQPAAETFNPECIVKTAGRNARERTEHNGQSFACFILFQLERKTHEVSKKFNASA